MFFFTKSSRYLRYSDYFYALIAILEQSGTDNPHHFITIFYYRKTRYSRATATTKIPTPARAIGTV